MSLLPARFQDSVSAMSLGPVVKPKPEAPVPHVCDWRPSGSSKDHVRCACGAVALREFVMPPAVEDSGFGFDPGEGDDTVMWMNSGPISFRPRLDAYSKRMRALLEHMPLNANPPLVIDRKRAVAPGSVFEQVRRRDETEFRLWTKRLASCAR